MADGDILTCENQLVAGMLTYSDWVGTAQVASVPYTLTIGDKREGDPRRWLALANFPAIAVQIVRRHSGEVDGQQQAIRFTVRMSVIYQYTTGDEPTTLLRQTTGQIIENILQTQTILTSEDWLNLDWIANILFPDTTYDNDLERYLRKVTADAAGTGVGGYTASQTDFTVLTYTV